MSGSVRVRLHDVCSRSMVSIRVNVQIARIGLLCAVCLVCSVCIGQDLTPRAYVITPIHTNAVILSYSYFNGSILFDPTIPITNAMSRNSVSSVSLFHTFSFFGRSASVTGTLPYGVGHFEGMVTGAPAESKIYRSGLADAVFRLSINVKGGPAMTLDEYAKWRQKTLVGVSFKLVTPTGQYDPTLLINLGSNRWAFQSELGFSRRVGHWILDAYGGVWFFTTNPEFFSHNQFFLGTNTKSEAPVGAFEGHISYNIRPRLWASLDANLWTGGRIALNGVENLGTLQRNSRIGGTVSFPVSKHQALKASYSNGAYVRYGGNYQNVSVGWQYSWQGRPN